MISFAEAMQEYLEVRRLLGFKLKAHADKLYRFVEFLEDREAPAITTRLALEWAKENATAQPTVWTYRLSVARQFALFVSAIDPSTEVPEPGLLPYHYQRKRPHIYTNDQVVQLMAAASRLRPTNGLRATTYSTVIGLLAVTGLRISEVIDLKRDAVDLSRALLTVHRTKFGKSRFVPLHESSVQALRKYEQTRDKVLPIPRSPYFFVRPRGRELDLWNIRKTYIQLSREVGLRGPNDSHGPRLHDHRHSFAVKTMVDWYNAGLDVQRQLPLLSTFLGHTHVADTYWYLSASPELLALAAERLDGTLGGLL
jgi:integrase